MITRSNCSEILDRISAPSTGRSVNRCLTFGLPSFTTHPRLSMDSYSCHRRDRRPFAGHQATCTFCHARKKNNAFLVLVLSFCAVQYFVSGTPANRKNDECCFAKIGTTAEIPPYCILFCKDVLRPYVWNPIVNEVLLCTNKN